jgi:hypothetical protein
VILIGAVIVWRQRAPLELRFSGLLLASVLVNPHVNMYDLTMLMPVFLLAAFAPTIPQTSRSRFQQVAYACCLLPFVGVLGMTMLPLTVPPLAYLMWRIVRLSVGAFDPEEASTRGDEPRQHHPPRQERQSPVA